MLRWMVQIRYSVKVLHINIYVFNNLPCSIWYSFAALSPIFWIVSKDSFKFKPKMCSVLKFSMGMISTPGDVIIWRGKISKTIIWVYIQLVYLAAGQSSPNASHAYQGFLKLQSEEPTNKLVNAADLNTHQKTCIITSGMNSITWAFILFAIKLCNRISAWN